MGKYRMDNILEKNKSVEETCEELVQEILSYLKEKYDFLVDIYKIMDAEEDNASLYKIATSKLDWYLNRNSHAELLPEVSILPPELKHVSFYVFEGRAYMSCEGCLVVKLILRHLFKIYGKGKVKSVLEKIKKDYVTDNYIEKLYGIIEQMAIEKNEIDMNESVINLNITKQRFNTSKYFQTKYGKLKYVSESGKVYKTDKDVILEFNMPIERLDIIS